jgi:APA family basic amino acid/polyamine antiporter
MYGLGVTVGAGIFALVGEIVGIAGDNAPLSFLVAGTVAGITGLSYMQMVRAFPRAGGEAVFANRGLGSVAGRIAGLGVVVTGIISSAAISVAFAGYVRSLVVLPEPIVITALVVGLTFVAARGIRESVIFAAIITVVEVGTLILIIGYGLPLLSDGSAVLSAFKPDLGGLGATPILTGAIVAFFAFVGFEDIANMAEETINPSKTAPRAILITLSLTLAIYVLLTTVAVMVPNRTAFTESDAPLAALFEQVSGIDARAVSVVAVVAMINGILVQIVMASRVLYGMAREQLIPGFFATVDPGRQTPIRSTIVVAAAILLLSLFFPLVGLAKATSLVTLVVFTLVDLSLFSIGTKRPELGLGRWRWVGLVGALLAVSLGGWQLAMEVGLVG